MKLKLTFLTICILILSVLCFSACDRNQDNSDDLPSDDESEALPTLDNTDFVTFYPDEPDTSDSAALEAAFRESDYYDDYYTYSDFSSYLPELYAEKYGIEIMSAVVGRGNYASTGYYLFHKSSKQFYYIGSVSDAVGDYTKLFGGIVHIALSDLNGDGYFELLISFSDSKKHLYESKPNIATNILLFDEKGLRGQNISVSDSFIFFKKSSIGRWGAFCSEVNSIRKTNKLYSFIEKNERRFFFTNDKFFVNANGVHETYAWFEAPPEPFPIYFKGLSYKLNCKTATTYLAEPFTQETGYTFYYPGAVPTLFLGDVSEKGYVIIETDDGFSNVCGSFDIRTGDKIYTNYSLTIFNDTFIDGSYYLELDYAGERVVIPNVFTITSEPYASDNESIGEATASGNSIPDNNYSEDNPSLPTLDDSDFVSFYPVRGTDRNAEEFELPYAKTMYSFDWDPHSNVSNVMPKVYSDKYGVELFSVDVEKYSKRDYFILYQGKAHLVHSAFFGNTIAPVKFSGITHMAISDANGDGYFELYVAAADHYVDVNGKSVIRSSVTVLDGKTGKSERIYLKRDGSEDYHNRFAFFALTEDGVPAVFCAETNAAESATELYSKILANEYEYTTDINSFELCSDGSFSVNFFFQGMNTDFPVYIKGLKYVMRGNIYTKYLGKEFEHTCYGSCVTATPTVYNGDYSVTGTVRERNQHHRQPSHCVVYTGSRSNKTYYIELDMAMINEGSYSIKFTFNGTTVELSDYLTVSKKQ